MKIRTTLARLGGTALLVALIATPLTASTAQAQTPEKWEPVTQESFSVPAGTYCDFGFSYAPDQQNLRQRVLSRYDGGAVEQLQFRGLLIGTFTNDETGATYTVNSSGVAIQTLRPDGTMQSYEMRGPVGMGFHATDIGLPRGYYIFRGHHVVDFSADGTRTLALDRGTEDNVCAHLSAAA